MMAGWKIYAFPVLCCKSTILFYIVASLSINIAMSDSSVVETSGDNIQDRDDSQSYKEAIKEYTDKLATVQLRTDTVMSTSLKMPTLYGIFLTLPSQDAQLRAKTLLATICEDHPNITDDNKIQLARDVYCESLIRIHSEVFSRDQQKWCEILRTGHYRGNKILYIVAIIFLAR